MRDDGEDDDVEEDEDNMTTLKMMKMSTKRDRMYTVIVVTRLAENKSRERG